MFLDEIVILYCNICAFPFNIFFYVFSDASCVTNNYTQICHNRFVFQYAIFQFQVTFNIGSFTIYYQKRGFSKIKFKEWLLSLKHCSIRLHLIMKRLRFVIKIAVSSACNKQCINLMIGSSTQ